MVSLTINAGTLDKKKTGAGSLAGGGPSASKFSRKFAGPEGEGCLERTSGRSATERHGQMVCKISGSALVSSNQSSLAGSRLPSSPSAWIMARGHNRGGEEDEGWLSRPSEWWRWRPCHPSAT